MQSSSQIFWNSIILSFFAFVILGGALLTFTFINQQSNNQTEQVTRLLADEHILFTSQEKAPHIPVEDRLRVDEYIPNEQSSEELKRDLITVNERDFDEGDYEYDKRTRDFRLVCSRPCPVSRNILDQEFAAISYAVSTLRGLTKADIDSRLLPFEVHATEDAVCPKYKDAPAYMSSFKDSNGAYRGKLCFRFDEIKYDRTHFPYSTSIHEVTHLFQDSRFPPYRGNSRALTEGLSMVLDSFFERGSERDSICLEKNNVYGTVLNTSSPHGTGQQLFYTLCKEYGFDYDDLPRLFRELDKRKGNIDNQEFVRIMNNIIGKDTSHVFRQAGII